MRKNRTKVDDLLELISYGPIRSRDLDVVSIPRSYLERMCNQGLIERVGRGLYRLSDAPKSENHTLAEVAKLVPGGVICLLSALQYYGLTSELPSAVWIMIERHARRPGITTTSMEIVRASGLAFVQGIENITVDGVPARISSPAKAVADCFRYRRYVGLDVAIEALRDYLLKYRGGMDALVEAARADRIYPFMRPYLEALA